MTFKTFSFNAFPILLSSALLVACGGGGGGSDSTSSLPPAPPATAASATFGDCFKWTPGVKFNLSNGSKTLIVEEQFEGQSAIGAVELRANETRSGARYHTVNDTNVQILGINDYTIAGVYSGKYVFSSELRFPSTMTPGQTVRMTFTETRTLVNPAPSVEVTTLTEENIFVGLEDLTLGGRTFSNVCKISSTNLSQGSNTTTKSVSWVANGFGTIRSETQTTQGVLVPGTRVELATVITAP